MDSPCLNIRRSAGLVYSKIPIGLLEDNVALRIANVDRLEKTSRQEAVNPGLGTAQHCYGTAGPDIPAFDNQITGRRSQDLGTG